MSLINKFRFKFSEAYRIRIGCGPSAIRNKREYNALIAFIREDLEDMNKISGDTTRKKVYEATLKLHESQGTADGFWFKLPYCRKQYYNNVDEFIEDHAGWYWS